MLKNTFFAASLILTASLAQAGNVVYSLGIEGVDPAGYEDLAAGSYNLQVFAEVTDNDLGSSLGGGGLLQYVFNLNESGDALTWDDRTGGFPPAPLGEWDAANGNNLFTSFFQGDLKQDGVEVFAQTGGLNPAGYADNAQAIGVGAPSLIVSGIFEYDGTATELSLEPGALSGHVIFANEGSFGAVSPTGGVGASISLGNAIPEPSTCILAGLALVGFAARRNG